MVDSEQSDGNFQRLIAELDAELVNIPGSPFSEPAFLSLREKINNYIVQLVDESFKIAKRHQSDVISVSYVEQANNHLVSYKKSRYSKLCGTVGGALAGLFLSVLYTMYSTNAYAPISIGITIVSGVAGAILITVQFFLD